MMPDLPEPGSPEDLTSLIDRPYATLYAVW
jgi:hypothetical protein